MGLLSESRHGLPTYILEPQAQEVSHCTCTFWYDKFHYMRDQSMIWFMKPSRVRYVSFPHIFSDYDSLIPYLLLIMCSKSSSTAIFLPFWALVREDGLWVTRCTQGVWSIWEKSLLAMTKNVWKSSYHEKSLQIIWEVTRENLTWAAGTTKEPGIVTLQRVTMC